MKLLPKIINRPFNFLQVLKIMAIFLVFSFGNSNVAKDNCTVRPESSNQMWPREANLYNTEKALSTLDMKIKPGSQFEGISALWLRLFHEIERVLPNLPITWVSGVKGQ
jgi:hypothetical protein